MRVVNKNEKLKWDWWKLPLLKKPRIFLLEMFLKIFLKSKVFNPKVCKYLSLMIRIHHCYTIITHLGVTFISW